MWLDIYSPTNKEHTGDSLVFVLISFILLLKPEVVMSIWKFNQRNLLVENLETNYIQQAKKGISIKSECLQDEFKTQFVWKPNLESLFFFLNIYIYTQNIYIYIHNKKIEVLVELDRLWGFCSGWSIFDPYWCLVLPTSLTGLLPRLLGMYICVGWGCHLDLFYIVLRWTRWYHARLYKYTDLWHHAQNMCDCTLLLHEPGFMCPL